MTSGPAAVLPRDAEVLAAVGLRSERFAAWCRLIAVASIAVALSTFVRARGVDRLVLELLGLNLAISVIGVAVTRVSRLRAPISWTLGLLDVVLLLGYVAWFSRFGATLPGAFKPALIETWGFPLAMALSALRGRPVLLAAQTALFAGGLAFVIHVAPRQAASEAELLREVAVIFGPSENTVRVVLVALTGLALVAATVRARANLREAVTASRRAEALSHFLAPPVASVVADAEIEALREGRQQDVAVLFADVCGFTAMAEAAQPQEVAAFLSAFRRRASRAVEREGGIIDKFVGDEVMGLFGVPNAAPDDAARAIAAGRRMLLSIRAWNRARGASGRPPVRIGVGVHCGSVFVGVLGEDRLEFTVLGDTVNVARRLEAMTRILGHDLLVSAETFDRAGLAGRSRRHWTSLPAQKVRGHREDVRVHAFTPERRR